MPPVNACIYKIHFAGYPLFPDTCSVNGWIDAFIDRMRPVFKELTSSEGVIAVDFSPFLDRLWVLSRTAVPTAKEIAGWFGCVSEKDVKVAKNFWCDSSVVYFTVNGLLRVGSLDDIFPVPKPASTDCWVPRGLTSEAVEWRSEKLAKLLPPDTSIRFVSMTVPNAQLLPELSFCF
jgi:hypothetical protein